MSPQTQQTAREKLAERYAQFLTARLDEVEADVTTPLARGKAGAQQNLSGKPYTGANPLFLSLVAASRGFNLPVWMTWLQFEELGLSVTKGEHGYPVQRWVPFTAKEKATGKVADLTEAQYRALPQEVRDEYEVTRPMLLVHTMFNIDQSNFAEVYPDVYRSLQSDFLSRSGNLADCAVLDTVLQDLTYGWACTITIDSSAASASYDPDFDVITIPPKEKYLDQKDFYSELVRCMAESTCIEERLNLDFTRQCGEEGMTALAMRRLSSELCAASVLTLFGLQPTMSETGRSHIKAWRGALRDKPALATDVIKASGDAGAFIIKRLGLEQEQCVNVQQMLDGIDKAEENRKAYQEKREQSALKKNSAGKGYSIKKKR